jgi:hypothetical protein
MEGQMGNIFKRRRVRREDGIALLIAVFTLLLLSAIALSMIYAANLETGVSANFREKQVATYGAASGLQMGRDLLSPGHLLINAGYFQNLPANGAAGNVIYIINPGPGESASDIAPWLASNRYADTELCHDQLNLSGVTFQPKYSVPCTGSGALPTSSGWYTAINSSATTFASNLPASVKWVRIQLKADNSAPVAVGTSPSGTQVCWNGTNQVLATNPQCTNGTGKVTGISVLNPGTGYSSAPTVTILGGGGSGATAVANMRTVPADGVASVTMDVQGTSYNCLPVVTIAPPATGVQALGTAVLGGPGVSSITMTNAGAAVNSAPPVTIEGCSGSGATATANLSTTADGMLDFKVSGTCKDNGIKGSTTTITFTGGSGSGATASITWDNQGNPSNPTITSSGTGYSSSNPPTGFGGLSACTGGATPTSVQVGYRVTDITVNQRGSGYATVPTVTLGNGGIGTANMTGAPATTGKIVGVIVTRNGSGYSAAPSVTFATLGGNTGSGASGTGVLGTTQVIDSITVTDGGSGYSSFPSVGLSGGGGSGAKARSAISAGGNFGKIYLITAMGAVRRVDGSQPAKTLMQMEAGGQVVNFGSFNFTGALTIDGPNPILSNIPNSQNFQIIGNDRNSCGESVSFDNPSVGVFNQAAVGTVKTELSTNGAKSDHYFGSGSTTPDVQNVFSALGAMGTTPSGMEALGNSIGARAATLGTKYGPNLGEKPIGTFNPVGTTLDSVTYIDGDLTLGGNNHGYGVLMVTGQVILSGDYSWDGPIFVIGQGIYNANGGGNGQINGALIVAKTRDASGNLLSSLGSPTVNFQGGGGNGIHYDHCYADNLMLKIPISPPPPNQPIQVLSVRTVNY